MTNLMSLSAHRHFSILMENTKSRHNSKLCLPIPCVPFRQKNEVYGIFQIYKQIKYAQFSGATKDAAIG